MPSFRRALAMLGATFGFVAALAIPVLMTQPAAAHPYDAAITGHVYVNDNTAGSNTIAGFDRHADGSLTPLPGSPFNAGGAGRGVVTPSQGALQSSSDGRYLLAVDAGSNQISVLSIEHDGTLRLVEDSPTASGGIEPVSIAVHGRLVYVANLGDSTHDANYTGFTLNPGGHLTPIEDSTVSLPIGSQPGDVLFNATGTRLVGTRVATSLIDSFAVGEDGRLLAAPGSPFVAPIAGPFGSAFRPEHPDQLFVSLAHGGKLLGAISAYHDAPDGTLTAIGASPYPDFQTAPCWVAISPNGSYLFAVNTASASISSYAIGASGTLSLIGSTPLRGGSALGSFDIRVSPDGNTVYVVDSAGAAVSAFTNDHGTLTELTSSPVSLPAGATPFGLVAD